jgi:hypothetical protein
MSDNIPFDWSNHGEIAFGAFPPRRKRLPYKYSPDESQFGMRLNKLQQEDLWGPPHFHRSDALGGTRLSGTDIKAIMN